MANRVLRDWTDSKKVDKLSFQEEVLFVRLIMKADDYGNFNAEPHMVKSLCFPRKDGIRCNDISAWLSNLEATGLILTYQSNGDSFLHIKDFKQRLDRAKRKYPPEPSANDSLVIDNDPRAETKRNETSEKAKHAREDSPKTITTYGTEAKYFVIVKTKYLGDTPCRINGVDGLQQYMEANHSILNLPEYAERFLRSSNGKVFNELTHLQNAYNKFIEKLYQ